MKTPKILLAFLLTLGFYSCGKSGGDAPTHQTVQQADPVVIKENISSYRDLIRQIEKLPSHHKTSSDSEMVVLTPESKEVKLFGIRLLNIDLSGTFFGETDVYHVTSRNKDRVKLSVQGGGSKDFTTKKLVDRIKSLEKTSESTRFKFDRAQVSPVSFCHGSKLRRGYKIDYYFNEEIAGFINRTSVRSSMILSLDLPLFANPLLASDTSQIVSEVNSQRLSAAFNNGQCY